MDSMRRRRLAALPPDCTVMRLMRSTSLRARYQRRIAAPRAAAHPTRTSIARASWIAAATLFAGLALLLVAAASFGAPSARGATGGAFADASGGTPAVALLRAVRSERRSRAHRASRKQKRRRRAHTKKATARSEDTLVIEGAGDGHGVGMSQWGALGFAEQGWSAAQILAHYYTGTALGEVSKKTIVKVLVGNRVVKVPIEAYVRGVVAAEMPSSWPAAALEAQAIASRTFALTDDAGGTRFNVYSDTRSQVYLGKAGETPQSNAAVKATAGKVVTYGGAPAITFFFASSGGQTESVQNVFGTPEPWLVSVSDPYDGGPLHHWTASVSFAKAGRQLSGYVKGSFEGIEVRERGLSPRVLSAYVLGSKGNTEVSGADLEERLGLYSTWVYFSVRSPEGRVTREPDLSGSAPPPVESSPPSESPAEGEQGGEPPSPTTTSPPAGPEGGTSTGSVGGGASAP